MRGDSVAFPPGGCAYLHRHQGPGIRCLIEGGIRIDTHGRSTSYGPGGAWYESGPDAVFAQAASDKPSRFIRVMILPRELHRQKLDPVRQRGGQGQAEDAELQDLRRRADLVRSARSDGDGDDIDRPPAGFFRHQGGGARAAARCRAARTLSRRAGRRLRRPADGQAIQGRPVEPDLSAGDAGAALRACAASRPANCCRRRMRSTANIA